MPLQLPKPPNPLQPTIQRINGAGRPTEQQINQDRELFQFLTQGKLNAALGAAQLNLAMPGVNVNALGDTVLTVPLPSGIGKYLVVGVWALNASISLTAARAGLYTAAAQGGIAIIPQTALAALTAAAVGAAGSAMLLTPATANTAFHTANPLYLNIGTVQGAAATADFVLSIRPMAP
jgi:hypothetical protein